MGPFPVITNGNMSADIFSKPTIIQKLSMLSYQITWANGTAPVGMMTVQVSNNFSLNADGSVRNAGTWDDLVLSAATPVSGASGDGFIDITASGAYAMRLHYARTSGTGTMQAIVTAKVS